MDPTPNELPKSPKYGIRYSSNNEHKGIDEEVLISEIYRRMAEFDAGTARLIDGDEVIRKLRTTSR